MLLEETDQWLLLILLHFKTNKLRLHREVDVVWVDHANEGDDGPSNRHVPHGVAQTRPRRRPDGRQQGASRVNGAQTHAVLTAQRHGGISR
jgi:hypothetical protein